MSSRTIRTAREYARQNPDTDVEVRYDGGALELMKSAFGEADYRPQPEGSLGQRMSKSFAYAFSEGSEAVLIAGSDCPDLSPDLLGEAFARLKRHDLVIGPALDGGYYLIGMKRTRNGLFPADMPWGTASVLERTLRMARKLKLAVFLLRELEDVDLPEDIARIRKHPLVEGLL
jgi:rSAM/selenodomain-associated transferase 1